MDYQMFNVQVATAYGVNAAILLQSIAYWCEYNQQNEKNYYDGRYWTYNTRKAFAEQFPYMSEKQIRMTLQKLKDDGLIVTGCYNEKPYDRTMWYSLTDEGWTALEAPKTLNMPKGPMEGDKMSDSMLPKGPMEGDKRANGSCQKGQPIPNIIPDIIPNNNNIRDIRAREEDNPFGEAPVRLETDTVYAYASNNLITLGHRAMEEIATFVDDLSEDIVRHAIDNALDGGVRTWAYVRTILNSYVDANVRTVGEAKAVDEQHRQKQRPSEPRDKRKYTNTQTQTESDRFWGNVPFY